MKSNEKTLLMGLYKMWLLDCGFTRTRYDDVRRIDSLDAFLAENDDWAKLIYAEDNEGELAMHDISTTELRDRSDYRNLSKSEPLAVSKEDFMRGVDYGTTESPGIALLIMKQSSSQRAYH